MKKVYTSEDSMMANHIRTILEMEGIPCLLKNQNLSSIMGEVPPIECWPEVWITDDDRYDHARQIIHSILSSTTEKLDPWQCICGEAIEGQFTACWQCGALQPE